MTVKSGAPPWRPIPRFATRPTTANGWAELAETVQGYVVVGMPGHVKQQRIGGRLTNFAQFALDGLELLIVGVSSFAEWKAQITLFQIATVPVEHDGGHYYRCELVPAAKAEESPRMSTPPSLSQAQIAAAQQTVEAQTETPEQRARRFELTLKAIATSTLCGVDFGDWVQSAAEDALAGLWPECYMCGTAVHEGPCVGEGDSK